MKLWQKIFLISLAFVMLAVSTTAVFVARSSFTADIRRDREAAAERHHYIASNIVNKITYERLRSGALTLPVNEMQAYAGDVVRQNAAEGAGIALYDGDDIEEGIEEAFLRLYAPPVGDFAGLAEALSVSEGPQSVICSIDGRDFLAVASRLQAEGTTFILLTTSDISDTYESYDNMLRLIGFMSCGFAVAFSLALLAVTYRLLRPLDTVNASIGMIAAGEVVENPASAVKEMIEK